MTITHKINITGARKRKKCTHDWSWIFVLIALLLMLCCRRCCNSLPFISREFTNDDDKNWTLYSFGSLAIASKTKTLFLHKVSGLEVSLSDALLNLYRSFQSPLILFAGFFVCYCCCCCWWYCFASSLFVTTHKRERGIKNHHKAFKTQQFSISIITDKQLINTHETIAKRKTFYSQINSKPQPTSSSLK